MCATYSAVDYAVQAKLLVSPQALLLQLLHGVRGEGGDGGRSLKLDSGLTNDGLGP